MGHALNSLTLAEIKSGAVEKILGVNDLKLPIALKVMQHILRGGTLDVGHKKVRVFLSRLISHEEAQPYLEATTDALNAVFHAVLIDTGGNVQPLEDLALNLYSGKAVRGKQEVRSIHVIKNRSGGQPVPANLKGKDAIHALKPPTADQKMFLSVKSTADRPSGVLIVEKWKTISLPMRSSSGPTATRLFLWRRPGRGKVKTDLVSMGGERWPAFIARHKDNPVFGGLPITRQVLRTAVINTRMSAGEFDFKMIQASSGHSSEMTTFGYLSEGAVRAFLNSQIRDFMNAFEAGSVSNIEDAARHLGISERTLVDGI